MAVTTLGRLAATGGTTTLTGTAGGGTDNAGIFVGTAFVEATGASGGITLTADSMAFEAGASITAGTNNVTLVQKTAGTQINLGAADGAGVLV